MLPGQARSHNRALVLQTLHTVVDPLSRADLARSTGLTRVTVSDLVAELLAEDLLLEIGVRTDVRPGKPATLLQINPDAYHVLGVDLSPFGAFRAAVVDLHGRIRSRHEVPTEGATGEAAVAVLDRLLTEALDAVRAPLLGIGVGTPGIVDAAGTVRSAPNLRWTDLPLGERLAARFPGPVLVANDANAAVMAEHALGGAAGDVLLVKVGFGVGAGLVIDGVPRLGAHSAAGEIGHVVVGTDGGPRCACGKDGCLEAWLSVPSLLRALAAAEPDGDAGRTAVLRQAGRRLGIALAPVVGALALPEVVLSGPPDLLDGELRAAADATLRERIIAAFDDELSVRLTQLGEDIVPRGAAAIVLAAELGVA
ncbi:ROK family protein [Georgenia sp. TF02-10]|uniref:ROK family protein n=1 Tax=Georgenia sp. TF02-10 TaxID=2917725 RepID=UPI001FA7E6C5|nr:ROK family protein [Georgenia sp. TF02-10]UNX56457.1 ROK family protein [Georgenia sp. TF02-10]